VEQGPWMFPQERSPSAPSLAPQPHPDKAPVSPASFLTPSSLVPHLHRII